MTSVQRVYTDDKPFIFTWPIGPKKKLLRNASAGLKISFTGPSDKMSDDVEFGSDICPMTFSSVLTRNILTLY